MRTLLKISVPVEAGNDSIKSGTLPKTLEATLSQLKPEAAYFFTENGKRTALIFFDLKDPSDIPVIAEPLFMGFNAEIEFKPVMNQADLTAGLGRAMANV